MSNDAPPFFDAKRWVRHKRTVTLPDGRRVTERRPIVKSCKAMNLGGHEIWFPLATGPKQDVENDPYGQAIVFSKEKQGMLIKARCPQGGNYHVQSHLPEAVRGRRICTEGVHGGPISDANPCRCYLDIQAVRQAENAAAMKKIEGTAKNKAERDAAIQDAILSQLLAAGKQQQPAAAVYVEPIAPPGSLIPDPMKDDE